MLSNKDREVNVNSKKLNSAALWQIFVVVHGWLHKKSTMLLCILILYGLFSTIELAAILEAYFGVTMI